MKMMEMEMHEDLFEIYLYEFNYNPNLSKLLIQII